MAADQKSNTPSLPECTSVSKLNQLFDVARSEYTPAHKRAYKLDAADKSKLWDAVGKKFPTYQILPDTNQVHYIKSNILASVYSVGKGASLIPTSDHDKNIIEQLNVALEHLWDTLDVAKYQMQAGERAALLNLGITQVGWDNSIIVGTADNPTFHKGDVVLKNINPMKFMRDPFATSIDTAQYCVTWDDYHKTAILANSNYSKRFKEILTAKEAGVSSDNTVNVLSDKSSQSAAGKKDYFRIFCYWIADEGKIHEIHLLNNSAVLYVKQDIKPSQFPFAELYCNEPAGDLFGTSECSAVFQNSLAYNLMLSIMLTAEYKNQRPPRFINAQSGLNVATFTKHGNDADRTFIVNGDASKAVHYHQFPTPSPQTLSTMQLLMQDIKSMSGVDDRYTGRDSGSILTTGGIESMLDQVTMIDAPKVENYERYCKKLTQLIVYNYLEYATLSRDYLVQSDSNPKAHKLVTVPFPDIPANTIFEYSVNISSELPKSKARLEAVANQLMEKQMQYKGAGIEVDLITPQEWLMLQDLPNKEYMLERMNIQRSQNWTELVAQAVTQYANMVNNGVDPEEAIAATADTMAQGNEPGNEDAVAEQMQMLSGNNPQPMSDLNLTDMV
jgi:hypothetical protein